jgi:hypothetical protein
MVNIFIVNRFSLIGNYYFNYVDAVHMIIHSHGMTEEV